LSAQNKEKEMTEQTATILLGIVGVLLQLAFKYAPKVSAWYQAQSNKGAVMLGFVVLTAALYFGVSCTPYAATFHISLACSDQGVIELLKAVFYIASGQSLTYLYTRGK